jgi:hypothetical protein
VESPRQQRMKNLLPESSMNTASRLSAAAVFVYLKQKDQFKDLD